MSGEGKAVIALLASNVIYLIGLLIFISIGDALPAELLSGPFFNVASILDAYLVAGGLLGILDLLVVVGFLGQLNSGF